MVEQCIFCRIISGELAAKRVYEDDQLVAIEDTNPQAPLHLLLLPRAHQATILELGEEHQGLIAHLLLVANRLAQKKDVAQSGFRLVLNCNADAGQSVYHVHLHLLAGRKMKWPPG